MADSKPLASVSGVTGRILAQGEYYTYSFARDMTLSGFHQELLQEGRNQNWTI